MSTPFEEVRERMQKGTALPSFTLNLLEDPEGPLGEKELELYKWTAGGIYAGAYAFWYFWFLGIFIDLSPLFSSRIRHCKPLLMT